MHRTVSQLVLLAIICPSLCVAQSLPSEAAESASAPATTALLAMAEEALPPSQPTALSSAILAGQLRAVRRSLMLAGCKVAPLSDINDPEGIAFEKNAETDPADLGGLTPDAAQALDTLKGMVTSLGGTFSLKSAYRPPVYQAHLHEVWVKWVKELRGNRSTGCRALREEVGAEFKKHQLLVRQQPVPASDHALGLAFDAAVAMPRGARWNGKRVTVDKLAGLAGIKRPNSRRDPVHFKVIPESPAATGSI